MATISKTSRYNGATSTIIDGKNYILTKKPIQVPLTDEDFYIQLDQSNQFRPDLISQSVYDSPDFGWAIMEVNSISNFLELKSGLRLRVPPLVAVLEQIPISNDPTT